MAWRRRPAVSTRMNSRSSKIIGRSIASRVVPPRRHDHPLRAQEAVDQRGLADVGPPDHRQADGVAGRTSSSRRGASPTIRSSRSPVPRPCAADTATGHPARGHGTPRPAGDPLPYRSCWRPPPRVARLAGAGRPSRGRPAAIRPGRRPPARPRRRRRARPAPAPGSGRASSSRSSRSTPPVSISVSARPFQSVCSSFRSRVTPGPLVDDRFTRLREPVDQRGLANVGIADDRDLHSSRG